VGSRLGVLKIAARRIGESFDTYRARIASGEKWCIRCRQWHPIGKFAVDTSRGSGLSPACRISRSLHYRQRYADDENIRQSAADRTMRRRRSIEAVPLDVRGMLLETFDGKCAYCDAPAKVLDHVISVWRGGQTVPGNILPSCRPCNASKGTKDLISWIEQTGRVLRFEAIEHLTLHYVEF
jgi:hypothetical protein